MENKTQKRYITYFLIVIVLTIAFTFLQILNANEVTLGGILSNFMYILIPFALLTFIQELMGGKRNKVTIKRKE